MNDAETKTFRLVPWSLKNLGDNMNILYGSRHTESILLFAKSAFDLGAVSYRSFFLFFLFSLAANFTVPAPN